LLELQNVSNPLVSILHEALRKPKKGTRQRAERGSSNYVLGHLGNHE